MSETMLEQEVRTKEVQTDVTSAADEKWEGGLSVPAKYCYLGPHHLPTGFGQAARETLKALYYVGLPICGKDSSMKNLSFFLRRELVIDDHLLNQLTDDRPAYNGPFEAMILHTTGDSLRHFGVPTYGYAVWETSRLPRGWADRCNLMDGLFTPSEFSKKLFVDSGVTKPIYVVPHPIDLTLFNP